MFHSEIVEGNKEILKKQNVLHWKWECSVHSLRDEMSALQELNEKGIEGARF